MKSVGQIIREHRQQSNRSQMWLADRMELNQSAVSMMEMGKVKVTARRLNQLFEVFGQQFLQDLVEQTNLLTDVERQICQDTLLSDKDREVMLACYGAITGRESYQLVSLVTAFEQLTSAPDVSKILEYQHGGGGC